MVCDTSLRENQTLSERKLEVLATVEAIAKLIISNRVKPVIDKRTGAITFANIPVSVRNGLTDACVYRRIMATGSALAKLQIAKAEQLAGRTVNRAALAAGIHSHDGGSSWGSH
jgi:hypothetical protein